MKVKEALKSISIETTHPVFLLKGDDHFLQEFFIKRVLKIFFSDLRVLGKPDYRKILKWRTKVGVLVLVLMLVLVLVLVCMCGNYDL